MAAPGKPRVLTSLETDGASRCVDLFVRSDGSYGFEEYRRDPEDPRGWHVIGGYGGQRYADEDQARDGAAACVPWFQEAWLKAQR